MLLFLQTEEEEKQNIFIVRMCNAVTAVTTEAI